MFLLLHMNKKKKREREREHTRSKEGELRCLVNLILPFTVLDHLINGASISSVLDHI